MTVMGRRVIFWTIPAVALAVGLFVAFQPRPIPVDLVALDEGPLRVTVAEEGETRISEVFVLSAPVAGRALRIELQAGDPVVADQTQVARIEPIDPSFLDVRTEKQAEAAINTAKAARTLSEAELEKAQADLDYAQSELSRARRLISSGAISQRSLDEAERSFRTRKAAVATAQAGLLMRSFELDRARAELMSPTTARSNSTDCDCVPIFAPVSGRILRILHKSERVVQAGESLVEIGDPTHLEVIVDLLSTDAVKVEAGQRVMIESWGGEGTLNGRVRRVEPYGFTEVSALGIEEQRVNVLIDLIDKPVKWARLGHGYRVETRIVLWEDDNVLSVPISALFRVGTAWAVFAEIEGVARQRLIKVGRMNGLAAQVLDGINKGTRVIVHPGGKITEGVAIIQR